MQIRYLEAMQSMAKTANSKVIFLPAPNQTIQQQLAMAESVGEGPSRYNNPSEQTQTQNTQNIQTNGDDGFQRAINARIVEDI